MKKDLRFLCEAGIIAAVYAGLTYVSSALGLAYGMIQFRISEALCVLAIFTPAAIPGLVLGCVLGNIGSLYGPIDMLVGSIATLLGALAVRLLRKKLIARLPMWSMLANSIANGFFIGAELCILTLGQLSPAEFVPYFTWVFLGEVTVCFVLGLPLYSLLKKSKLFSAEP